MFTARDKKLWKMYLVKLHELGITNIAMDHSAGGQEDWHSAFSCVADYGATPVLITYRHWTRLTPGMVIVRTVTDHSERMIIRLTATARITQYSTYDATDIRADFFLLK